MDWKKKGCNNIICPQCHYQWCWLCKGIYNNNHYEIGGNCVGLQFENNRIFQNCFILNIYKCAIFLGTLIILYLFGLGILVYLFYHFFKGNFNQKCFYTFLYGFFQVFYLLWNFSTWTFYFISYSYFVLLAFTWVYCWKNKKCKWVYLIFDFDFKFFFIFKELFLPFFVCVDLINLFSIK